MSELRIRARHTLLRRGRPIGDFPVERVSNGFSGGTVTLLSEAREVYDIVALAEHTRRTVYFLNTGTEEEMRGRAAVDAAIALLSELSVADANGTVISTSVNSLGTMDRVTKQIHVRFRLESPQG